MRHVGGEQKYLQGFGFGNLKDRILSQQSVVALRVTVTAIAPGAFHTALAITSDAVLRHLYPWRFWCW